MWVIALLTLGLPWVIVPGIEDPFWETKGVVWMLGCAWLIGQALFTPTWQLKPWKNRWVGYLLVWVMVGGLLRFWLPYMSRTSESKQVVYNIHLWIPVFNVFLGLLTVRVLSGFYLTSSINLTRVTQWLCWSATAVATYLIFQSMGIEQWIHHWNFQDHSKAELAAWFGNSGEAASFLAPILPLFLCFKERRYLIGLGLVLLALLLIQARYALVAGGLGLLLYSLFRSRAMWQKAPWRLWGLIGVLVCLSSTFGIQWLLYDERWMVWKETVYQWAHGQGDPWTGNGLESFKSLFRMNTAHLRPAFQARFSTTLWSSVHNEWLQSLYETGLIGVGLMGGILWSVLSRVKGIQKSVVGAAYLSGLAACLIISLTYFPWRLASTAWVGMLMWSVVEAQEA